MKARSSRSMAFSVVTSMNDSDGGGKRKERRNLCTVNHSYLISVCIQHVPLNRQREEKGLNFLKMFLR